MTLASYDNLKNRIVVSGDPGEVLMISRIPGAKIAEKGTGRTVYTIPATLDSCFALKKQDVRFTQELKDFGNGLNRIQRYIEAVKLEKGHVEPILPVPIKAPYSLYQHQLKAYNIALALFGRGARKEQE